jgi:hypothetical protein
MLKINNYARIESADQKNIQWKYTRRLEKKKIFVSQRINRFSNL